MTCNKSCSLYEGHRACLMHDMAAMYLSSHVMSSHVKSTLGQEVEPANV